MGLKSGRVSGPSGVLAAAVPLAMLSVVTILAFANAWPDRLVLDDKAFAGPGRAAELDSLHYIFTHEVWASVGTYIGLYRPLLLSQLSLETWLFGDWLAGYHLSNIFQHLLVTLLLYGFLRCLLHKTTTRSATSELCALLSALVFAVHPIHTEVVNSVFNRSDMMVAMFCLGGLWWLLHHLERHAGWAWSGLAITYSLAMLSKENAVVIPGLALALVLMTTPGDLVTRMRKCLPVLWLLLPLAAYLWLRANALFQPELGSAHQVTGFGEISAMVEQTTLPGFKTFLKVGGIFGEALRVCVWPYPLRLKYPAPSMPLLIGYAGLHLCLIIAATWQARKKHYGLAVGLAFFYLAMLPSSRIISMGESGPHLAERYVYFPSIGLAMLLAFALSALAQRFAPRALVGAAIPLLLVFTTLTWDRNADWRNEVSLFGAEYQRGSRAHDTLRWVTAAYLNARNFSSVAQVCDDNLSMQEIQGDSTFVQSCATAYEQQQRPAEAERAHLYAIEHEKTRVAASMSLARFYLRRARPQDARERFLAAIEWSADPAEKALNTAEMIIQLNPESRQQGLIARGHIEEALRLRPGWAKAEVMLQAMDRALNSTPGPQE